MMTMAKTTEAGDGGSKILEQRVAALESYINKDIRKRKRQKREVKRLKREATDPAVQALLANVDDTDDEQELGT